MTDESPSPTIPQPPAVPVSGSPPVAGSPGTAAPPPVAAPHQTLPYETAPPRTRAVNPPSAPRYADRLAETASDAASTATAALGIAADAAGDFVRRQQPFVMAAVFGLGVFLGILIRRR